MMQLNAQALMSMPYEQMVACIKSWNRHKMEESRCAPITFRFELVIAAPETPTARFLHFVAVPAFDAA